MRSLSNRNRTIRTVGLMIGAGCLVGAVVGCAAPAGAAGGGWSAIERYARPLLELDPNANWTQCYNALLERGPDSIDYLLARPEMNRRAAPDDLRTMLTTSLLRLLAEPREAPRLSVSCYETTLDLLHFEPKVLGRSLGEIRIPAGGAPAAWHDLYPAHFNHLPAQAIDVERDRRLMALWWQTHRVEAERYLAKRPLRPQANQLWHLLSRRYADVWTYEARPAVFLCRQPPASAVLLRETTYDYNLVRAACVWLGTSEDPAVQSRLIELVAHPAEIVAYNALFALRFERDPRIRELIERYNNADAAPAPEKARVRTDFRTEPGRATPMESPCSPSCSEQGSAPHEVDQIHHLVRLDRRGGRVHRGSLRRLGSPPTASRSRSA